MPSRNLSLADKDAYEQELVRARAEGRKPKYKSVDDAVNEGIAEENRVWGSQSMVDYGKKGRHETRQQSDDTDKELGVKSTGRSTVIDQSLPDESEHLELLDKKRAEDKASGAVDPDVYDANRQLGLAIGQGIQAGYAAESDDDDEDFLATDDSK